MIELARVVAIHPEDHSIDCAIIRTGQRCVGVQVAAPGASTNTGTSNLPPVDAPAGEARWNVPARGSNDAVAMLAPTAGGNWVCVGFLFPQVNGVLSAEPGRQVTRHSSGAWSMIAPDGTVTIGHPSGAVVVFGPNLAPTNPVGGDVDGQWRHGGAAAAAQVGLHVAMPSGASFTIDTDGKLAVKAIGEATFDVPVAKFSGSIEAAGDVTAGGISLQGHRHSGVQGGAGNTGTPI
ncbi:hypothetical protein EOD42_22410 [Rhodovarius crocodyli]|uniref:Baseplate assembly protein n=1 Tax=Rhodovarius crocodyli TaxID=1979269 RepID=A0A437M137_9PROT|nr:phage baseplate assembly protein [Rhodovarius crocodyli]RVT91411.1 hypothetical protein EOD42_22410 [Rhodovarius crocodyli]